MTWLLALGPAIAERSGELQVPVFLGDALQWNLRQVGDTPDVVVDVPDESPLHIPTGFAEDQARFEYGLQTFSHGLDESATAAQIERQLLRFDGVTERNAAAMAETYGRLHELYETGRNGIWPFVLRNLMRPLWLSRPEQRADVVIGNPPWIAYRFLSAEIRPRLRAACRAMNLWVGGRLATNQDISALFWARGAERYLLPGGTIAFVLPYAALNRPAFGGVRGGDFDSVQIRLVEAWDLARVSPMFGQAGTTSSCVLFGRRETTGPLPPSVERFAGSLSRRNATEAEADADLIRSRHPWPPVTTLEGSSPYRARFKQGANFIPRRFFIVDREAAPRLGDNPTAPRVRGKTSSIDRAPWSGVDPPRGAVESEFLRPLILGESVAPFRLLRTALAVIPVRRQNIFDAGAAADAGFRHLAMWMREIDHKWQEHCNKRLEGSPRMTLIEQLDHMRKLSMQLPPSRLRVVYNKAGTRLSAAVSDDERAIVDTMAYWTAARNLEEARYLTAILNATSVVERIVEMQPRGASGPRHFDNLPWELPIPEYDGEDELHRELAAAAAEAERIAALVPLREGAHFTAHRRAIRAALAADGIAARIDALVIRMLDG